MNAVTGFLTPTIAGLPGHIEATTLPAYLMGEGSYTYDGWIYIADQKDRRSYEHWMQRIEDHEAFVPAAVKIDFTGWQAMTPADFRRYIAAGMPQRGTAGPLTPHEIELAWLRIVADEYGLPTDPKGD